jgi:HPt (histidine-containing phosphotransfer) domain-containing protein
MLPQPPEAVFDTGRLDDIAGDDAEFRRQLLDEFLDVAADLLSRIEASAAARDGAALAAASHSLKGSARTVGADAFGTACAELERLGREGRLDGSLDAVARARDEFVRLEPLLRRHAARA